jgi:hypothetical protein
MVADVIGIGLPIKMVMAYYDSNCPSSCKSKITRGAKRPISAAGREAETFYDTQQFQYGARGKWGYSFYNPQEDKAHHIYALRLDTKTYIKPWEQVNLSINAFVFLSMFEVLIRSTLFAIKTSKIDVLFAIDNYVKCANAIALFIVEPF